MRMWVFQPKETVYQIQRGWFAYGDWNAEFFKRYSVPNVKAPMFGFLLMSGGDNFLTATTLVHHYNDFCNNYGIKLNDRNIDLIEIEVDEDEILAAWIVESGEKLKHGEVREKVLNLALSNATIVAAISGVGYRSVVSYKDFHNVFDNCKVYHEVHTYVPNAAAYPIWNNRLLFDGEGKVFVRDSDGFREMVCDEKFAYLHSMRVCPSYFTMAEAEYCCDSSVYLALNNVFKAKDIPADKRFLITVKDLYPDGMPF